MQQEKERGVLLHISSLPSNYGIGTFGESAYRFVDFLSRAGFKLWQVLPLTPTSFGDSPYQSPSAFAGNPYFIDLDSLVKEGLLTQKAIDSFDFGGGGKVDYGNLYKKRYDILRVAYNHFIPDAKYEKWRGENDWLRFYSLFMCIKKEKNDSPRCSWRSMSHINNDCFKMDGDEGFWEFLQYKFQQQWFNLKKYANASGIKIIGDMPIYVANDSADFWANKDMFLIDEDGEPSLVAGVPPDLFSETGQLWGNPLYDWNYLRQNDCNWWLDRIWQSLKLFDMVRIDHFRGFESFYAIDAKAKTAEKGEWLSAHGLYIFNRVWRQDHNAKIIAEDLGTIDEKVRRLVKHTGYPSMKVFQFAFDGNPLNDFLPQNYSENCIAYTGTHDNNTTLGWYNSLDAETKKLVRETLDCKASEVTEKMITKLFASCARYAVVPMQDLLNLGASARMNTPSTPSGNWQWRLTELPAPELADEIKQKYFN